MKSLLEKINRNLIVYLPRKILEQASGKDLIKLDNVGMTNNLIFIKDDGKLELITYGARSLLVLKKEKDLKANIFELMNMKTNTKKNALNFLLDNYFTELDTYINLTYMIMNNAKDETINYISDIQWSLDLQHKVLKEHKVELKNYFGDWKLKVDLERVFGYAPMLKPKNKNSSKTIKQDKKNNTKRVFLITGTEADNYILNTVFNIDIAYLSKK